MISDYDVWASLDASGFAVYRLRELELAPLRMTVAQASVLRVLETAGPLTAKMLRDLTLRQQNTISIIVARMAASGLVEIARMRGERESRISITAWLAFSAGFITMSLTRTGELMMASFSTFKKLDRAYLY